MTPSKLGLLTAALRPRFYGYFQGHCALTQAELKAAHSLVGEESDAAVAHEFEREFARMLGGEAVSFAAGRMAFYATLQALGIGLGDEVLLTGHTCAVMPNAVWRTGATATYADIARETLGTDPADVARKITAKTRAIVVQHTFGLPCDIEALATLARNASIPLIEDCALTVGTSVHGRQLGSWGDAAIFSTDHSKPLNTLTGGFLVTQNHSLAEQVRGIQTAAPALDIHHRQRLWQRLLMERRAYSPRTYGRGRLMSKTAGALRKIRQQLLHRDDFIFLEADFKPRIKTDSYAYPARLPEFLAKVGLFELKRWPQTARHRQSVLKRLLEAATPELMAHIPAAYRDAACDIVPLRLAYAHPAAKEIECRMRKFVDIDYVWFREPIICATFGPSSFGYIQGTCPVAEHHGKHMVNWPCDVPEDDVPALIKLFTECHRGLQ